MTTDFEEGWLLAQTVYKLNGGGSGGAPSLESLFTTGGLIKTEYDCPFDTVEDISCTFTANQYGVLQCTLADFESFISSLVSPYPVSHVTDLMDKYQSKFEGALITLPSGHTIFIPEYIDLVDGNKYVRPGYTGMVTTYGSDYSDLGINGGSSWFSSYMVKIDDTHSKLTMKKCTFGPGNIFIKKTASVYDETVYMGIVQNGDLFSIATVEDRRYLSDMCICARQNDADVEVKTSGTTYTMQVVDDTANVSYRVNALIPQYTAGNDLNINTAGLNLQDPDDARFGRLLLTPRSKPFFKISTIDGTQSMYCIRVSSTVGNTASNNAIVPISAAITA